MIFKLNKIQVGDMRFHIATRGRGKMLILLHGLANNWEGHIPLATELSKNYQVLIPDLPGYGHSSSLPFYSLPIMAGSLAKLVKKIGMKPTGVVGLSMGGVLAAEFAYRYPELTKSSVVMGPVLGDKHVGVSLTKYFFKGIKKIPGGRRAFKKVIERQVIAYFLGKYVNMYKFDKKLIDLYGTNGKKLMTPHAYIDMGISVADYNLDQTLRNMILPTLLIYGQSDKYSSPFYAHQEVIPTNSNLRINVIPEAGHVVSLEKPKETAHSIDEFIRNIE